MYIMMVEKLILSEQKTEQLSSPVSVGVHLHLFYPDLIPVFLEYLGRIPVPFSLFVSVPDGVVADDDDVEKSFRMLSNVQEIIIKHTPNRGRDIAPMLCGFADEFRKYEVMLHLHTKKSPHGKMQAGWLEHILEHLLPSPALIQTILIKLQRDAGMVVPPDFIYRMTPDGWGVPENIIIAQQLIDRSDMRISLKEEYPEIDFPQGSMFWARTEYLKRLFALDLKYEDFPEEPIGVDGTIAHALERLFFLWGHDYGKVIYRTYISKLELIQMGSFLAMTRQLATERLYVIKKNNKHLMQCRILSVVCVVLLVLWLISIL